MAWPEEEKNRIFVWCLTNKAVDHLTVGANKIGSGNAIGSQQHVSRQRRQKSISSGKPILRGFFSKTTKIKDQSAG